MSTGAITGYIDVAQLVLYAFWIFFAGLIIYLRREDKREGYPLESDRSDRAPRVQVVGFPRPPEPKTFLLPGDQGVKFAPHAEPAPGPIPGTTATAPWNGSPLVPTGDPMRDGVGPASYADRDDLPDLTIDGVPKVVPMRVADNFIVEPEDPDPRGMAVVAADGRTVGTVKDLWVDRAEPRVLYFEVALAGSDTPDRDVAARNNPLLPYGFARVRFGAGRILVSSIMSNQFEGVPRTASGDRITRLEEDRITAYFSSGHLYADPKRQEPLI
ncbi:photosynthetic reaction center subunit H [Halomonas denitrificans]|nr:photosynthetic reaction center subunit H [Halomonas denitrificans]